TFNFVICSSGSYRRVWSDQFGRVGKQYLCTSWVADADRTPGSECHIDCGIFNAAKRKRYEYSTIGNHWCTFALASYLDDISCICCWDDSINVVLRTIGSGEPFD